MPKSVTCPLVHQSKKFVITALMLLKLNKYLLIQLSSTLLLSILDDLLIRKVKNRKLNPVVLLRINESNLGDTNY